MRLQPMATEAVSLATSAKHAADAASAIATHAGDKADKAQETPAFANSTSSSILALRMTRLENNDLEQSLAQQSMTYAHLFILESYGRINNLYFEDIPEAKDESYTDHSPTYT